MRWVFIAVIALNVLYFGWHLAGLDGQAPSASPTGAAVPQFPTSLQLLSEAPATIASQVAVQPPSHPPVISGCPSIGPFATAKEADRALGALKARGQKASSRELAAKGLPVYWVYIPAYPTKALALRQLRELHARGVDSFVVSEGAEANAISLGTFSSRDSARGVQSRMRSAGYPAEVREQSRDMSQYWVVMSDPAAQGFLEFVPRDMASGLKTQRVDCAH